MAWSAIYGSQNIFYNRLLKDGAGPSLYGIEVAEKLLDDDLLIQDAYNHRQHIQFSYDFMNTKKVSKYNKRVVIRECALCKSRKELQTHHIVQQQYFNKETLNKNGFYMNSKQNLVVLCSECHKKVENRNNNQISLSSESSVSSTDV